MSVSHSASNFGLDIQRIHGPKTHDDLTDNERQGHDMVTIYANTAVSKGSMDFLMAIKKLKAQAEIDDLEVADDYYWYIRKPLTKAELDKKLKESQKEWQEGLEQYLWIAADISNKQEKDAGYKEGGRKARKFQEISERLGFKVTPFWEFEYEILVGYEKISDDLSIEALADENILEEADYDG